MDSFLLSAKPLNNKEVTTLLWQPTAEAILEYIGKNAETLGKNWQVSTVCKGNPFVLFESIPTSATDIGDHIQTAVKYAKSLGCSALQLDCRNWDIALLQNLLQRLVLAWETVSYPHLYKQKKDEEPTILTCTLLCQDPSALKKDLETAQALGKAVRWGKDRGNQPPNTLYPETFVDYIRTLFADTKVAIEEISAQQAHDLGMLSLYAVQQGSVKQGRVVIAKYFGLPQEPICHLALVGKGVTFDSGGLSLKPPKSMEEMKFDMCGASSVMATLSAAVQSKLALNLVAIVGLVENMPSGHATRPGDIVTTLNGKTVEILNTDAEGRLVLCDLLTYVQKHFDPKIVIDVATLTGACVVALGEYQAGLYSNKSVLRGLLHNLGEQTMDKAWPMPLGKEYSKQIVSKAADLANIGGQYGGSVTAAAFLQEFVDKDRPWVHLDIAGVAWKQGNTYSATGRPIPLLFAFTQWLSQHNNTMPDNVDGAWFSQNY